MSLLPLLFAVARGNTCDAYGGPERFTVDGTPVDESSGLAASRTRPGVFFTHDDAGGDPVLYAVDLDGRYLGSHLVRGAALVDWEDLAPGPCPNDGEPCLYIGDIGDNDSDRAHVTIYVTREPDEKNSDARRVDAWNLVYPDGPHDAETLLVHPCTGDVYLVTKTPDEATGAVYRVPDDRHGEVLLEHVADIALDDERPITGGQWDPDGDRLAIRTRDRVWEWQTDPSDPDAHWDQPPTEVARVDDEQGEGVAFSIDGALVTSDEGHPLALTVVRCLEPAPADGQCRFEAKGGCGCDGAASPWAPGALVVLALLRRRRSPTRGRPAPDSRPRERSTP